MDVARTIDLEKIRIEAKYLSRIRAIFKHMASDAKNLYLATKTVPAQSLADNYHPEFLKIVRDMQRETIKKFGFAIRENAEEKGFNFKVEKYKALIAYHIDTKDVEAIFEVEQVDKVNNGFALAAALFVANSSEDQADYITDTNAKEISEAEKLAVILFFQDQAYLNSKIGELRSELQRVEFEEVLGGSQSLAAAKKKKILKQIEDAEQALKELVADKDKIIANNIEERLVERGGTRSPLIASQNVGMAEAWARQEEAEIVDQNVEEIEVKKRWTAILDSHTRPTHVVADGQTVGVNENFTVGGYPAKMPRDPNLPMQETANCRCVAVYLNQ